MEMHFLVLCLSNGSQCSCGRQHSITALVFFFFDAGLETVIISGEFFSISLFFFASFFFNSLAGMDSTAEFGAKPHFFSY
jgi:hypothetical protein